MKKIIEIYNLTKRIRKLVIIDNINLDIFRGEWIAILGANITCKTTLIKLIANITTASTGTIKIFSDQKKLKRIGLQFQEGYWPKGVTLKSIIKYYVGKKVWKTQPIIDLINTFDIANIINKDLNNLSGGEKQRFNAMLAIINVPEILILDELITGLDLKMQVKLINFFKNYLKDNNKTLLMISHIPEEVESLCQRVILLEKGKIIYDKKLTEIQKEFGTVRKFMQTYYEMQEVDNENI